jgi:hypothetical protein
MSAHNSGILVLFRKSSVHQWNHCCTSWLLTSWASSTHVTAASQQALWIPARTPASVFEHCLVALLGCCQGQVLVCRQFCPSQRHNWQFGYAGIKYCEGVRFRGVSHMYRVHCSLSSGQASKGNESVPATAAALIGRCPFRWLNSRHWRQAVANVWGRADGSGTQVLLLLSLCGLIKPTLR